jgi:hypothetical protein
VLKVYTQASTNHMESQCGVFTFVVDQWCGYCWGKSILQESMNIQCMKQQIRSYILLIKKLQHSCCCSKQNKIDDQSKFEDMHT